ncbi:MAG: peptidoglycan-associated lipoprotein, partial [Gammaproteobacteria bacterium]
MKIQLKFALLLTAVLLSACNKKVKEEAVDPNAGNTTSGQTKPGDQGSAIVEEGAFGPSDLDSNACLRQRVVYFDYDQDMLKPEYQAIVACHAKYLRDRPAA